MTAILPLILLATCAPLPGPGASSPARARMTPRNGLEVIGAMRRVHPSRDLRTLSFTVTTTDHRAAAPRPVQARAHARLPGRHREARLPSSTKSGVVRDRQRLAVFEQGRLLRTTRGIDLERLLAYDVFAQSIDTTIMWLDSSTVRFGLARRATLDGRDVWVVGAEEGDLRSPQFWVDADLWRVARVIQRDPRDADALLDVRFTAFADHAGVPVPVKSEVYRDGTLWQTRVVSDVQVNPRLPSGAFDLSRWTDIR